MSASELAMDVLHGNFSHAWERLQDFYNGLPLPVRNFIGSLGTDEGKILQSLVTLGVADLAKNGFTTDGFVKTGEDILAQLIAQNIQTFTLQHVIAALNIEASPVIAAQAA